MITSAPRFGMVFPPYGSHYVGMAKEWYDNERLVQEYFEEAGNCLSLNFVKLCFASSDVELSAITNAYPALFLVEAASAALAYERGIQPNRVASFDIIGWYASLHAAKSVTLPDGLYMLHKIALLYDGIIEKDQYNALDIKGISLKKLTALCKKQKTKTAEGEESSVVIARVMSDTHSVVVGHSLALDALRKLLRDEYEATVIIEHADLHAGWYVPFEAELQATINQYLEKIDIKEPQIPVIDPRDGSVITAADSLKKVSQELFFSPISYPAVIKEILTWERRCIVVPSVHFKNSLTQLAEGIEFLTIENTKELQETLAFFQPPVSAEVVMPSEE